MKYKFADRLKQAILIEKDGGHAMAMVGGLERPVRCLVAGIMGKAGPEGIRCLVAEDKAGEGTGYTVVAVQGSGSGGGKEWICVHPALMEQVIGFFFGSGQMGDIVVEEDPIMGMASAGKCRPDFRVGNSLIEILIADLHCQGGCIPSLASAIRQAGRYCSQIRSAEEDKKIVLLLVFQHGHREPAWISDGKGMLKNIMKEGVEVWSVEVTTEVDGISLLSYHNMADSILKYSRNGIIPYGKGGN